MVQMSKFKVYLATAVFAAIPLGTYAYILYTRPNIYQQIEEEIKRQEAADAAKRLGAAKA